MSNEEEIKWLGIYQVRSILASRGLEVPLGKEGYELIIANGFVFDEVKYMWREVR